MQTARQPGVAIHGMGRVKPNSIGQPGTERLLATPVPNARPAHCRPRLNSPNRRMRTRMYGGVGGASGKLPLSRSFVSLEMLIAHRVHAFRSTQIAEAALLCSLLASGRAARGVPFVFRFWSRCETVRKTYCSPGQTLCFVASRHPRKPPAGCRACAMGAGGAFKISAPRFRPPR
jgi:hypothetical protein